MTTITESWASGRAARTRTRKVRPEPLVAMLVGLLARLLPTWGRLRSTVLQLCGFVVIDVAFWRLDMIAGLFAIGVSLFLLEFLGGGRK